MSLGGLIGLGVASTRSPVYEASARVLISVDRSRTSIRDDFTIYQADDRVRALILSDATLQRTLERLTHDLETDVPFETPAELRAAVRIAQHPAGFDLFVYSEDPQTAASTANAWAMASMNDLEQASLQAILAAELQTALYESHCRLDLHTVGDEERVVWVCTSSGSLDEPGDLPEQLLEAAGKSRGILPFYSFSMGNTAPVPEAPVLWNRSGLIIAGLVGGLVVGWAVCFYLANRERGPAEFPYAQA